MDNFRGDTWVQPAQQLVAPGPFTRLVEVVDKTERIGLRTTTLETNSAAQSAVTTQLDARLVLIHARVDSISTRLDQYVTQHDQQLQALHQADRAQREALQNLEAHVSDIERGIKELAQHLADAERRLQHQLTAHDSSLAQHERRIHDLEGWCKSAALVGAKPRK
jgi:predicted RNase H-like nuclease (RuvC/YqgF family)